MGIEIDIKTYRYENNLDSKIIYHHTYNNIIRKQKLDVKLLKYHQFRYGMLECFLEINSNKSSQIFCELLNVVITQIIPSISNVPGGHETQNIVVLSLTSRSISLIYQIYFMN